MVIAKCILSFNYNDKLNRFKGYFHVNCKVYYIVQVIGGISIQLLMTKDD